MLGVLGVLGVLASALWSLVTFVRVSFISGPTLDQVFSELHFINSSNEP